MELVIIFSQIKMEKKKKFYYKEKNKYKIMI